MEDDEEKAKEMEAALMKKSFNMTREGKLFANKKCKFESGQRVFIL